MPRKTLPAAAQEAERAEASMRPRPDAAENRRARSEREPFGLASMRPRPDAAENAPENMNKILGLTAMLQ